MQVRLTTIGHHTGKPRTVTRSASSPSSRWSETRSPHYARSMIDVCVAGITGWVGEPLAQAIGDAEDLRLVAGVARRGAGTTVHGVPVFGSLEEALETPSDVLVEYTGAD